MREDHPHKSLDGPGSEERLERLRGKFRAASRRREAGRVRGMRTGTGGAGSKWKAALIWAGAFAALILIGAWLRRGG